MRGIEGLPYIFQVFRTCNSHLESTCTHFRIYDFIFTIPSQASAMQSPARSQDLDQSQGQGQGQGQHLDEPDLMPVETDKSTGFDASPYAERQQGLSRRPTRVLDPRSPLTRLASSITEKRNFSHPLAPQKTGFDALVDFDGPDDLYRPLNWPNRKKFITVLLYGLTTMCSSWASSMYIDKTNT